ncbi:MAG TPA: elongation factor G, partial [Patescibacteria group bacterium]|nr:elongation factor G [Patescibacteria group bacterium]
MTTKSVDTPHLRSVVLAGHAGAGKTTLAEALLYRTGTISRQGRVEDGTTTLDFEPEEQKRHMSLSLAVSSLEDEGNLVSLIDTPGYPDFVAEVVSAYQAVDSAMICVDATGGVEAGTENAVALARHNRTAALFVVNKCDRENAEPAAVLDALRDAFGTKIAPLQIALGKGDRFSGYVDLVHRRAYRWDGRQEVEVAIPAEVEAEVATRRDQLLEAAAEADDDVLAKYLEGEEITGPELEACLHRGVRDSLLAPVLVASATKGIGLRGLLDAIVRYLPAPAEGPPIVAREPKSGDPVEVAPDAAGPLLVRVFKTTADPFVGRLTYLRVVSGTLRSQSHVWNAEKGDDERVGQLLRLHGKEQEAVGELKAGEIGAVAKLSATATGDALATKERPFVLDRPVYPAPTLVVAIEPQTKADLDKMGPALQRMLEEEPSVRVERSATGEQLLVAMGETQIAVITERLKRKFGSAIATHTPRIPYRETIRGKTQVEGRYKKQTGGHGMFGHVWLTIEPNPDGGVAFAENVVGGTVPKNFFPGVEKGVRAAAAEGILAGYPLVDFKATLYDGSFHTVDSNDLSFQLAASLAVKKGVMECRPVLQEPIMSAEIRVPERFMGDVTRDLNGRRGRVLGMDVIGDGMQVITAMVPQAELFSYAT